MRLAPRSIRFRLIAWYAGWLIVLSVAFGLYTYASVRHSLREAARQTLDRRADSIASTLVRPIGTTGEAYVVKQLEARYAPVANDRFIRLSTSDRRIIYVSGIPNSGSFDPQAVALPSWGGVSAVREAAAGGDRLLIVAREIDAEGQRYLLETGYGESNWADELRSLAWSLAFGLPLLAVATGVGGWFLIDRALRPVGRILGAAKHISLLHLDRRLPAADTGDEMEALSRALNEMIARLDEAFRHASQFSADASHELRTPLTIMRGELELALRDSELDDQARHRLASLLEEAKRLAKIVEGLFAISRLESGEATIEPSRFDLADLTMSTAEQMHLLADDRALRLTCRTAGRVEIKGDRARLKQVVVNLLDNAIKYTPCGGDILLSVTAEKGNAILRVANTGPGLPPAALPRLFDRFFRGCEGSEEKVDGSGLGLSIVRSICLAHGGSVEAANEAGGCAFTVKLPLLANDRSGDFFRPRAGG